MSESNLAYKKVQETVSWIQKQGALRSKTGWIEPQVGIILGSGLGSIADEIENPVVIPYSEIPNFQETAVLGHTGKLYLGQLRGVPVACLQGRFHFYEGHSMDEVVLPARTLCQLGIHTLAITNAAGGINTRFRPGDLMLITDHLNLVGNNPLRGPNIEEFGPRFPDLSEAYHLGSIEVLKDAARRLEMPVHTGVYAGLLGPTYETPAEVRMLRILGADAVGMSTVAESIAANHCGARVVGISCVTNLAAGLSPHKLTHAEVLELSKVGAERMKRLLVEAIPGLGGDSASSAV